jgi:hypothetical protein
MPSVLHKAGALLLGGLGLGLLLANAALTHGCAAKHVDNAPAKTPAAIPDEEPGYMHATKAPVMGPLFEDSPQTEWSPSEESAAEQAPSGAKQQAR